jgi:hypothetical protein
MGLATWAAVVVVLVLGLLAFALFDQSRARKASASLLSTADDMVALPIASMRNGAQIILLRRLAATSEAPFVLLHAGESRHLSADEIKHLWKRGRLWWYYADETPPLGLSYYLRYVDGHYSPACRLHGQSDSEQAGR